MTEDQHSPDSNEPYPIPDPEEFADFVARRAARQTNWAVWKLILGIASMGIIAMIVLAIVKQFS